jgi:hypothetical protein
LSCNLCTNDSIETIDHIFLHCELARAVWFGADINIRTITEAGIPVHKWIHDLLLHHKESNNKTPHFYMILTLVWCIWFHRNQVHFEGKRANPMEILLTAKSLMNRFLQNQINNAGNNEQERSTTTIAWQPHDNWQILITTAGAHNGNWKRISYMGKSREGHILFVGCQSITAHDTKMAKA